MKDRQQIGPILKEWLDNVLVPAMVRDFLAKLKPGEKLLASSEEPMAECAPESMVTSEREK